jgi:hypothetical protein
MVTKTYDDPRVVRFDTTKVYATIVGTVLWALTCGLLMAVYLHDPRTDPENWRLIVVTAHKNHPHAWPTLYTVMGLMLMYASMIAR